MRYQIDLRGNKYLEMEYQFVSTAALQVPKQIGNDLSVLIYGFIFHHPERHSAFCSLLPKPLQHRLPVELFYAGWAKLSFEQVIGGEIQVHPYKPAFPPSDQQLLLDSDGKPTSLFRSWDTLDQMTGTEYVLECTLEHPYGAMRLMILAAGKVGLSVDMDEFVVGDDACGRPELGYDQTRSHQLRSIM